MSHIYIVGVMIIALLATLELSSAGRFALGCIGLVALSLVLLIERHRARRNLLTLILTLAPTATDEPDPSPNDGAQVSTSAD